MEEYGETSTEQRDLTRGRGSADNTAKAAGMLVIGAVVLLAIIRGGFRGRVY